MTHHLLGIGPFLFLRILKGKGPIAGIYTALIHCQSHWMAVMPVDMPYLNISVSHYLSPFCIYENPVVAESDAGLEPLVSFWPRSTLAGIENCLKNEELGLYRCLKKLDANQIDCSEAVAGFHPSLFANINCSEDLKKSK